MSSENVEVKPRKIRNGPLIGLLIFAILFGLWWGVPTYRKARADATVRELCAKDGGIKVYETVKLAAERFDRYGFMRPPLKQNMKPNDDFFYTWDTTWIIPETGFGSLAVWKGHQKLFRVMDQKLLGEAIWYSRRGGDPIGPWHPSSFSCPMDSDITVLAGQVFIKQ